MSDEELDNLMDEDLESKYSPMDKINSLSWLEYEYTNISKVIYFIYLFCEFCH